MYYVLLNKKTGNYFKREIVNNLDGRCVDVDTIAEAKTFDNYQAALSKSRFIGGTKYEYTVVEINN